MFTTQRFYTILIIGMFIAGGLTFSLKNGIAEDTAPENTVVVSSEMPSTQTATTQLAEAAAVVTDETDDKADVDVKIEMSSEEVAPTEPTETVIVESKPEEAKTITINVTEALGDRVLGNPDAPVTIVEYASMTCSHCAKFHNENMAAVKKEIIDSGKAKIIMRDYPLDGLALRAAMLARCAPKDKYFNLVEVLFANQEHWTTSKNPLDALSKLGRLAGISKETFNACLANKELETGILRGLQIAQREFKIRATPTFIFNDGAQTLSGVHGVQEFHRVLKLLPQGK